MGRWLWVPALLLAACGGDADSDAGPPVGMDAGDVDSGVMIDAGDVDGGDVDAGDVDAGDVDAGMADAGMADAGMPDAGMPDAGMPDAGRPDAGAPDAGAPDAGPPSACMPSVPMTDMYYARFEGIGANNSCSSNGDCVVSGCSAEVCAAELRGTTCELLPYGPAGTCQCNMGTCMWATGSCSP